MKKLILLSVLTAFTAAATLAQDAPPPRARATRSFVRRGQSIAVNVDVDVTSIVVDGRPAVLGAYVASISFDPKRVELMEVQGAEAGAFATAPIATDRAKANERGLVKLAAAQTNPDAPTGDVAVARLTFRETTAGGASSIHIQIDSAAAARRASNGSVEAVSLATE